MLPTVDLSRGYRDGSAQRYSKYIAQEQRGGVRYYLPNQDKLSDKLGSSRHVTEDTDGHRLTASFWVEGRRMFVAKTELGTVVAQLSSQEMTRGNQREKDREKAQKKLQAAKGKEKESAASLQQRRERDAQALREKQQKKAEAAGGGGGGGGGGGTTK
ncbi:hypothetical protein BC835DRAFT_1302549 [Cytidiella melzeri]|nr:hypothetical protein BC835DRAFT_1302549 [Cytidiella melzeri]